MDRELRYLRRELAGVGSGQWCPEPLRSQVGAWCNRRRAEGESVRKLADELGVRPASLRRWASQSLRSPAPQPIEIVPEPKREVRVSRDRGEGEIRIVTPAGLRIEGLAIEDVIAVVRVLG